MENNNINTTSNEPVVWPTNTDATKKKQKRRILYLVLAVLLTVSSAFGSFYLSKNLNQASTPNAPESQPAAAGKNQTTNNTKAEGCTQGCGSDEYCDNTRCRKIGGKADGRNDGEKAWDSVVVATPTPKGEETTSGGKGYEAIPGYTCSAANCNSGFHCINANTCVNTANPNLSVANDILNCGGTGNKCTGVGQACIGGQCVIPSQYDCKSTNCDFAKGFKCLPVSNGTEQCVLNSVTSVTPTSIRPTVTAFLGDARDLVNLTNPNNCGGSGPCSQSQECVAGVCKNTIVGAEMCADVSPYNQDGAARSRECCVKDIGVVPVGAAGDTWKGNNGTTGIFTPADEGKVDFSWHWTNCAPGTTCRQGVGCIGSPTRIPDRATTEITTTTTVTMPPTTTVTIPPTTTVTIPPTITATPTGTVTVTVTPTIAVCNETCEIDEDCSDGLFCDSDTNKCRKEECSSETSCVCPTETPEPTIVDCNARCNSDDNCSSGLKCDSDSGRCRKPACSDEKDCSCPKVRKTDAPTREITTRVTRIAAQPTVLKEAGILDFPGVAVFGSGLLLTVIGILLAL